ncbi:arsinothricin resistance N-acetyltransferase ArsN1 family A [Peribacillus deserti]|uniref:GNAT family N-acetyltransferase n=1 Tax=Peribacillus deserti TaxID=673318 RepID=A0A2N5M1F5_9BACI|nr:arsinothricin resistance N-acetyltransferase ArsN1 family A [Peribacillus deserti]PLT28189.1 GNAT family N-acetyltransferase [Peribacillus deserti]
MNDIRIRNANRRDLDQIMTIYNEGIVDRIATLETEEKDQQYMLDWFDKHGDRYKAIVAEMEDVVVGWASLNIYNARIAYNGVADLSVYIQREYRGKGIGGKLISAIEVLAKEKAFHKIVLSTFPFNELGQSLYKKMGFRIVGVYKNQGLLDGSFVDVMAMEKLLI